MAQQGKLAALFMLALVATNCIVLTFALPQNEKYYHRQLSRSQAQAHKSTQQQQQQQQQQQAEPRKYVVKPNATKKVALDDIEEESVSNQVQETPTGFSWSNILSTFLTMFFNGGANNQEPSKSDDIDNSIGFGGSPWANVISMGLKIINTLLGGGAPSDGIDKVDNSGSQMQFIQIVMNLLDALKTSFSHRSLTARALGRRDSVSDAAVAAITMMKGYARTYNNNEEKCLQRYLCEANTDCVREIGGTSIFCQLGSYATSFALDRTSNVKFNQLYEAGRSGRSGFDCKQIYLECNEV